MKSKVVHRSFSSLVIPLLIVPCSVLALSLLTFLSSRIGYGDLYPALILVGVSFGLGSLFRRTWSMKSRIFFMGAYIVGMPVVLYLALLVLGLFTGAVSIGHI
jgi:hypothetical protein